MQRTKVMVDARRQTHRAAEWHRAVSHAGERPSQPWAGWLAASEYRAQKYPCIPPTSPSEGVGRAQIASLYPGICGSLGDSPVSSATTRINVIAGSKRPFSSSSGQREVIEQPEPGARAELGDAGMMHDGEDGAPTAPSQGVGLGEVAFFEELKIPRCLGNFLLFTNTKPFHCECHIELSLKKCGNVCF